MAIKNQIELERISKPKYFDKDEYICYEGQLGKEMYVVLRGSIGVFITGVLLRNPILMSLLRSLSRNPSGSLRARIL